MELTPIRSRGKVPTTEYRQLMKKRKRLMSEDKAKSSRSTKHRRTQKARIHVRLDALPAELIQEIFIRSREINFPLASPRLGRKLTGKHVYLQFCFQVFYNPDYFLPDPTLVPNNGNGEDAPEVEGARQAGAGHKLRDYQIALNEHHLQSNTLKMAWLSWDLYREYLQKAFETCQQDYEKWTAKNKAAQAGNSDSARQQDGESIWPREMEEPQPVDVDAEDMDVCKEPGYRWFRMKLDCHIPEKLLHVPFTHERLLFLKTLIRAGAVVDWYGSTAGELAEAALEHNIREGRLEAVRLLLHQAIGIPWQGRYLEQAYRERVGQSEEDFERIITLLKERRHREENQHERSTVT